MNGGSSGLGGGVSAGGPYGDVGDAYGPYLQGAAGITMANAEYQLTIQQAKSSRQEAIRSGLQTRRAYIEAAEYERAHMPDPEKIRQRALARELDRARVSPPLTEIWSGCSLNALLSNLIAHQGKGMQEPNVPLRESTLKFINLTSGDRSVNVGLLKNNGRLKWPQPLLREPFTDARENLQANITRAVQQMHGNSCPDDATIADLEASLKKLNATLDASMIELPPSKYIIAKRYLELLGNTVTALEAPYASNYLNGNLKPKGTNVSELVKFMAEEGLWFAPAMPGDESAYLALYRALVAFDSGGEDQ